MKLIRGTALFVGLLGVAGATQAGVSSSWTLASDYDFRGVTQSARDPALQASLDYAHDSGWYIGAWGSNVDFGAGDPDVEVDLYTGFTKSLDSGLSYDFGGVYYTYHSAPTPGANYVELYAGLGYEDKSGMSIKGKFWHSPDFGGSSTPGNTPAEYIQADFSYPLPAGFSFDAHAGYSFGDYWSDADSEYFDYSIGIGYTAGKFSLAAKFIDGSDLADVPGTNVFDTRSKVVVTVATTFPWGE
ncbi:MAG TPA: TorF family putative porin [Steroidobacteraceae bacterium]|jgi:uncharacterized protein (TIGR02001 family)|nr:TorF family putative porin [Steroidobacteraceae bacterium]